MLRVLTIIIAVLNLVAAGFETAIGHYGSAVESLVIGVVLFWLVWKNDE